MEKIKILTQKEKGNNRHWKNFVDKEYLGSHNLERGEEMLLTIEKFEGEEMVQRPDGEKEPMRVLYFSEDVPKMIVNNTNANIISALYDNQPEKWINKQIQVYATPIKAFGKMQDALRIRDFIPKIEVDVAKHTKALNSVKKLKDLKQAWTKLPVSAQNDEKIVALKNKLKSTLK